jgi:threonine synthase
VTAADRGLVGSNDRVVVLNTGSGLKDVASAMKAVESTGTRPLRVTPDLPALAAALRTAHPEHRPASEENP